jgi:hypothetical protein
VGQAKVGELDEREVFGEEDIAGFDVAGDGVSCALCGAAASFTCE